MTDLLIQIIVPRQKILQTSYGLSTNFVEDIRCLQSDSKKRSSQDKLTFILVGSIGVRKGVHLLLDYWVKANLNANLILIGAVEPAIEPLLAQFINQHNITQIPFTDDLVSLYNQADVFILPSLEEGSPLVTYLAMGAGLPMLLTPMGAGGIVTHNVEGFVIEPYEANEWVTVLRKINEDAQLRARFANASRIKTPEYFWDSIAKNRLSLLTVAHNQQ